MSYNPQNIPSTPLPVSMMPAATEIQGSDLLLLVQTLQGVKHARKIDLHSLLSSDAVLGAIEDVLFARDEFIAQKNSIIQDASEIDSGWVSVDSKTIGSEAQTWDICHVHVPEGYDVEFLFNSEIHPAAEYRVPGKSLNAVFRARDYFPDTDSYGYEHVVTYNAEGEVHPDSSGDNTLSQYIKISASVRCDANGSRSTYPDRVVQLSMYMVDSDFPYNFSNVKVRAICYRAKVDEDIVVPGAYISEG